MVEKGPTLGSIETSDFTVRGAERRLHVGGAPTRVPAPQGPLERPWALGAQFSSGRVCSTAAPPFCEGVCLVNWLLFSYYLSRNQVYDR